jgi:hypothetical protein
MIPILILLVVAGIGFAAYEASPKVHAYIDEHVAAIHDSIAAHSAADAHEEQAATAAQSAVNASSPEEAHGWLQRAWAHIQQAAAANAAAASSTATAASTAATPQQKAVTAQSAAKVDARNQHHAVMKQQIATALQALGTGQCDEKVYQNVTRQKRDALIAKLQASGSTVTGTNPYDIATTGALKLRAVWNPTDHTMHMIVAAGGTATTCAAIWAKIDAVVKEVVG